MLIINPLGKRLNWKYAYKTFWENIKNNVDLSGKELLPLWLVFLAEREETICDI